MLYVPVALAFAVSSMSSVAIPSDKVNVVAVPFAGAAGDTAGVALSGAVENALPQAAKERGLSALRADAVKPVAEAFKSCRDDGCRVAAARRLGARYAILGATDHGALLLRIVDVEVGDAAGSSRVDGEPPAVLAAVPGAVDALVDQVAPKATHARTAAIARARKARAAGDLDDADAAFAEAVANAVRDDAVNLWLERCRLFDAADREREAKVWDAFAAALGPGTPGYAALDDDNRARVRSAVHENLLARADYEADVASGDRSARLTTAARIRLKIAALFPDEAAAQSLAAAQLYKDAGDEDGARGIYERLAADDGADDDARVKALARMHAR